MIRKFIKNSAQCLRCGDILVSEHRHDFKQCSCGHLIVDGGLDYIRRAGTDIKELDEWEEIEEKEDGK